MSYKATVFKVMIASPNDVTDERSIIRDVLTEWNVVNSDSRRIVLLPVGWETHVSPDMGDRPQKIINKQVLKDCDMIVGVFWTRIGTPTDEYVSGTVEEIEEYIKEGKPVMLYFSSARVILDNVDQDQYAELNKFKDSCKSRSIFETYADLNDFKSKFYRQLQLKVNQDEYFKQEPEQTNKVSFEVESMSSEIPRLSREAQVLLKEASQDYLGNILRSQYKGGIGIRTNGKQLVPDSNPRNIAIWEGALDDLEDEKLITDRGHKREVFSVTREGYRLAELINP